MSNATDVGSIRASFMVDIADGKRKMAEIKKDMTQAAESAKKSGKSFKEMGEEIKQTKVSMSDFGKILATIGSTAGLGKLISTMSQLTKEANALSNALSGVKQVAGALGQDVNKVTQATEQLANRGILSLTEAANAVKTGLATGYGIDETVALINTLTDAAAYNREAHYEWGEAVVVAMQGIKAGNSTLTDAAGITTNLSVMYDQYAKSLGTTADKLTDAGKAQAAYNGMMKEASIFAGNADTALEGYTGTNNAFKKSIEAARVELGEAYMPLFEETTSKMTEVIQTFTGWANENREVVTTLGAVTVATMAVASAVGVLSIAVKGLSKALGPVGWAITAIGALVTGITAYTASANAASTSAREFAESQSTLNAALEKTNDILNAQTYQQMDEQAAKLTEVMKRYNELMDEYTKLEQKALAGEGSVENTHKLFELGDAIQEVTKELKHMGYASAELAQQSLSLMNKKMDESLGALVQLTRQQQQSNIQAVESVSRLRELSDTYERLNSLEQLSEEQKQELTKVIQDLEKEYPSLLTQLDEEHRWHIANKDALDDYISGEENRVKAAVEAARKTIETAKIEAETRVSIAKKAMEEIAKVENTRTTFDSPSTNFFNGMVTKMLDDRKTSLQKEISTAQFDINEADKLLRDLASGTLSTTTELFTPGKTKEKSSKSRTAEDFANDAYRSALQALEMRRLVGKLTLEEEIATMQRLADKYKQYDDIWIDAESRRQSLVELSKQKTLEASSEWIEQETRKMTLAGKSTEEITKMQIDAWTRVRNRYAKDTDYYKRADDELYRLRVDIIRKTEQAQKDAEQQADILARKSIKAIEAARDAELKALNERKKAMNKYYDEQLNRIDEAERARDRSEIEAEANKYRFATSEEGKKHYAELIEQLRQMDVEDTKKALENERDAKLDALDQQESDIKAWYEDMKAEFDDFSGDMIRLYQLTENERFKAFTSTNTAILSELHSFKSQYDSIMSGVQSGSKASVIAQMSANAAAWHTANTAGKQTLAEENQRLGASIGANYSGGKWFGTDGVPLFHTGRDGATGQTFRLGDRLMPDELTAILRTDEYVFTQGQLRSLLDAKGSGGNVVNIEKVVGMELNDTVMEDEIDVRALGRTAEDLTREIVRSKVGLSR